MDEMIREFKTESKPLIDNIIKILEDIEGDFTQVTKLEEYGQIVDRIMGGAQSLALAIEGSDIEKEKLIKVGKYAELCKTVGYKGSQIKTNHEFYNVVVALLLDATEMLQKFVEELGTGKEWNVKGVMTETFLGRLQWISRQFNANIRGSVSIEKSLQPSQSQEEIDKLLKQLGVT